MRIQFHVALTSTLWIHLLVILHTEFVNHVKVIWERERERERERGGDGGGRQKDRPEREIYTYKREADRKTKRSNNIFWFSYLDGGTIHIRVSWTLYIKDMSALFRMSCTIGFPGTRDSSTGPWSQCSVTCGDGSRSRVTMYTSSCGSIIRQTTETTPCHQPTCSGNINITKKIEWWMSFRFIMIDVILFYLQLTISIEILKSIYGLSVTLLSLQNYM